MERDEGRIAGTFQSPLVQRRCINCPSTIACNRRPTVAMDHHATPEATEGRMTMLTLGEAARLTGLGKTTIQRSIKAGRLSATRTEFGSYQIAPAELHRAYPIPAPVNATVSEEQAATPDVTPVLEAQINALRQVAELLRQQLDDTRKDREDLREDRDRWRSQAERLALPAPATAVASRPWWRRIGSKA
jgi:excisionase family DNA binding protein